MDIEIVVIPEQRTVSLHSEEIIVNEGETLGQVIASLYPNLIGASPSEGKIFSLVFVLTGKEVDKPE